MVQIESFYLGCLSHASYMVSSEGVAAVIDPQRDVDIYIEAAARAGVRIEHVIETHLHADFVSGHHELAQRTGARIYIGDGSGATFPHAAARDGDSIEFGRCKLEFRQTPGHTLESICIVLTDLDQKPEGPRAVFTGDTLFVGDVGRPDLAPGHTPQELAALLYRSLHEKLLTLPEGVEIFPAHGAGSLCGKQLGSERSSTIGKERKFNYALQAKSSDEFIHLLTDHLPPRPEYFRSEVELNRQGAAPLNQLPHMTAFAPDDILRLQAGGALVVDTRPAIEYAVAHIPDALHIALTGQYASWAARTLGLDKQLILVAEDDEAAHQAQIRLARVGIENVAGYLQGGLMGWIMSGHDVDYIPHITAQELVELRASEGDHVAILDVREPGEVESGAIEGSVRIPLGSLAQRVKELDPSKLVVVHCKSGYRSSIATSVLRRAGFRDIANLTGGYDAWKMTQPAIAQGTAR